MISPSYYPKRSTLRSIIYEYNQYEEIDIDEMLNGSQVGILGISIPSTSGSPDELYTYMYYSLLQRYMFAEIGYDTDEIFISRLKAKWNTYNKPYYNILSKIFAEDSGFFNRIISRNYETDKTGNNTDTRTDTISNSKTGNNSDTITRETDNNRTVDNSTEIDKTITGNSTGTGQDTEYGVQTKTTEAQNNTSSTEDSTELYRIDEILTGSETRNDTHRISETVNVSENRNDTHTINENTVITHAVTETDYDPEKFSQYLKVVDIIDEFTSKFSCLFMQVFTTM